MNEAIQNGMKFSLDLDDIYIVTPIDRNNKPDLTPLIKSSQTVGKKMTLLFMNQQFIQGLQRKFVCLN